MKKYQEEWKGGPLVLDNKESQIDPIFLDFIEERSVEGLSESPLQFLIQFYFIVFYVWLSQAVVSSTVVV